MVATRPDRDTSMSMTTATAARGTEYAELSRQIRETGLLERRPRDYLVRGGVTVVAFAAGWAAFALIGSSWYQLITAAVLGVLFTQVAFLGHDAGHRQICRSRQGNDALGYLLGDLLVGLSFGWWLDKHNRHHSHPNHEDADPDVSGAVFAFTANQLTNRRSRLSKFVARRQAWLFLPILTLEGLHLHVASVRSLIRGVGHRQRLLESVLMAVHLVGYFSAVFLVLGPLKGLAFMAVHQAVFGFYMGCSFAPNHKGMPTFKPGETIDFLRRQVLTSRNVRGGRLTDIALGGLNYQVEHHLFPSMPRANLKHAQPIVRSFCEAKAICYTETSLIGSYAAALGHLNEVGSPLRAEAAGVRG
jgi:fatty acid desaturase